MGDQAALHLENIVKSPASTIVGVATGLGVVGSMLSGGTPTSTAGWINFGVAALMSILAMLSKA